jgi:hypothetical protein
MAQWQPAFSHLFGLHPWDDWADRMSYQQWLDYRAYAAKALGIKE